MLTLTAMLPLSCGQKEQPDNGFGNQFSVSILCEENGEETKWSPSSEKKLFVSDYERVTGTVTLSHPVTTAIQVTSSDPKVIDVRMVSQKEFTLTRAAGASYGQATIEVTNGEGNEKVRKTFTVYLQPEEEVILTAYESNAGTIYAYKEKQENLTLYMTENLYKFGQNYREVSIPRGYLSSVTESEQTGLKIVFKDDRTLSFPVEKATITAPECIKLRGWKSASCELPWSINVDIPGLEPVFEFSGDFFEMKDEHTLSAIYDNNGPQKEGTITISEKGDRVEKAVIKVIQATLPPQGVVVFEDFAFEDEMLKLADSNSDGYISQDETLNVTTIEIVGKGVRDLKGIENFKKVWKLDLRNNNIIDATCLKELPLLYWLDLKGNMNLKTFDVTGCTEYFEHCAFEVSEGFKYYGYTHQMGLNADSDPEHEYREFVHDERQTQDWSNHKKMYMVKQHTKTMTKAEFPWLKDDQDGMVPTIVFSGLSYIDVDFQDGSWKRVMDETYRCYTEYSPIFKEWGEYFDIYYMEYLVSNREKFLHKNLDRDSEENTEIRLSRLNEIRKQCKQAYDGIFGDTTDKILSRNLVPPKPTKIYPAQLLINLNCDCPRVYPPISWDKIMYTDFEDGQWDVYTGDGISIQYQNDHYMDFKRAILHNKQDYGEGFEGYNTIQEAVIDGSKYNRYYLPFLKFAGFLAE